MTLADAIAKAHQLNEDKIAAGVARVSPALDADELLLLEHFTRFCSLSGCKNLGCRPQVITAYIRSEKGADPYRVAATCAAISRFHDYHGLLDPCTASCVRAELGKILNISPPRSWRKAEQLAFMSLPVEIRAAIERREHQRETVIRRLQNECAEAKRQAQKPVITEKEGTKSDNQKT
jgi:hypothetical protein